MIQSDENRILAVAVKDVSPRKVFALVSGRAVNHDWGDAFLSFDE